MDAGIVGLPNVGKSTLFNALTKGNALAANYPFATIEPNVGVVPIPDPRLARITKHIATQKVIPASLRLVDIAGIVKGASAGEGLGNKFLSHIREVDALVQVVRCFTKAPGGEEILHVSGSVDPLRDVEIINTELILADMETVDGSLSKAERAAKSGEKETIARYEILKRAKLLLDAGKTVRSIVVDDNEQRKQLKSAGLITSRRVLYVMNVDEDDLEGTSPTCLRVREFAKSEGSEAVPVCAKIESELGQMNDDERQEMLEALGLNSPRSMRSRTRCIACWVCNHISRLARRNAAHGPLPSAQLRHKPQASSIPTLSEASSVQKFIRLKILKNTTLKKLSAKRARCGSKARTT